MKVLVFGNPDHPQDSLAFKIAEKLSNTPSIVFEFVSPNSDLPLNDGGPICILDTIIGIDKVTLLTEDDLDKLVLSPRNTAHDYDLGFQLKYLTKIGRLKKVFIIGLPVSGIVNYAVINKLLAQVSKII